MAIERTRPKTRLEKEYENNPMCPYDPMELLRCENHKFPPDRQTCEKCLKHGFALTLAEDRSSDAMTFFIAYKNFRDAMEGRK